MPKVQQSRPVTLLLSNIDDMSTDLFITGKLTGWQMELGRDKLRDIRFSHSHIDELMEPVHHSLKLDLTESSVDMIPRSNWWTRVKRWLKAFPTS